MGVPFMPKDKDQLMKDNVDLILSIIAASLFVLGLIIAAFILFRIYLKRKNKLLLEKERLSIQYEQTLLRSKLEIQEQTLTNVSREIHDNIGQVLSMVRINMNTLKPGDEQEKIELMDELLEKAITDLRSLSHSLNTEYIRKGGWIKAVQKLFTDLERSGKYNTYLQIEETLPALGDEKPIILFRMVQEIINNILKHAGANEIGFHAVKKEDNIIIAIRDNGKGFDTSTLSEGNGLTNLQSRAKMIDAELQISSQPGNGTKVIISVNTDTHEQTNHQDRTG
jgi:signal transduction histidine kinase